MPGPRSRRRTPSTRLRPLGALGAMVAAAVLVAGCGSGTSASTGPGAHVSTGTVPSTSVAPATAGARVTQADLDWPTYDRTAGRSGVSVTTPAPGRIRKGWTAQVDGDVYGQPLVVGDRVFVATENDSVYALSETTGRTIWRRHLASPVTGGLPCGDIEPSGITGTPVIDTGTGRLYTVTFTASPTFHHTLWVIATATGRIVGHRGIDVPGSDPRAQQERSALTIVGNRVYVPFGGLDGDCSTYKGRVAGAPLSGPGNLVTFSTDNQNQAGIWEPPGAVARDGSLYVATGNGEPANRIEDSDSVLRLSPSLRLEGRFTPSNYLYLSSDDRDLGTTSPALLPDDEVFMVGKQGLAYLLNGAHLGGTGGSLATRQLCSGAAGGDAVEGEAVVVSCYDGIHTAVVHPGGGGHRPSIAAGWAATGFTAGPPIIAGGVVWDVTRSNTLVGFRLSTGRQVFATSTDPVVTSFPSLSASGSSLFVPEGHEVVSYRGV